jgi:transmembrane sensor
MTSEPSRYVEPALSEQRVSRLWSTLSERLERRPSQRWRWLVLATALSGAAAGALFLARAELSTHAEAQAVLSGAKLETKSDALAITLVDGSKVQLAPRTELSVRESGPASVALALARGRADLDVSPREGRRFTVVAGDVEVRVVGTRFSVKSTPEGEGLRVEVSVLRGVVEVQSARRPGIVARVAAGQSWIQLPQSVAPAEPAGAAPPGSAPPAVARPETPVGAVATASAAPAGPSARELFEKAGERRRSGDAAGAARAYEELLRSHPGDGRASLSAFELGRLRMDRLGDAAGAIVALERAVALNVGPTFREDALARLVSVYAKQGNFAACGRARDRYLASYPGGVHAAAVSTRCGTR